MWAGHSLWSKMHTLWKSTTFTIVVAEINMNIYSHIYRCHILKLKSNNTLWQKFWKAVILTVFCVSSVCMVIGCNDSDQTQIAKILRSKSIRYWSDTFVSDQYLTHIDPRAFAIWEVVQVVVCLWVGAKPPPKASMVYLNHLMAHYTNALWDSDWNYVKTWYSLIHLSLDKMVAIS